MFRNKRQARSKIVPKFNHPKETQIVRGDLCQQECNSGSCKNYS